MRRRSKEAGAGTPAQGRATAVHGYTACRRRRDAPAVQGRICYPRSVTLTPFHVAVQVRDLEEARRFYTQVLGCAQGRSAADWVDFNMFGHQFVCHLNPELGRNGSVTSHRNLVDGHGVPVPHCGVVLEPKRWAELAARLRQQKVDWVIEPYTRFVNTPGEQSTLFIRDPSGNALEFKSFGDIAGQLFAS